MFFFGHSEHHHDKHDHPDHEHSDPPFQRLAKTFVVSKTSTCANPIPDPISSRSLFRRSTTQPTNKMGPGPMMGGILGALLLFVLFIGVLVVCIRRKGPASHSRQRSSTADSSTKILNSETPPVDSEADESVPKAATTSPGMDNLHPAI